MSLENSQYTYHSLRTADKEAYQQEVDRIIKEADHVGDDEDGVESNGGPSKRGKYSITQPIVRNVSGIVLEVILEDFLCHTHMTVTLNKEIAFIVGRNGSGKSAILTGLVVALGGNASNTGRGAALKDFIRHGCDSARVTCVISNSGTLNFKREIYGDRITIVRTLKINGSSTISLKSDKGKLVSSKMEELRNMNLALGIQVDNPISVLDQNTARHFLNQSKPSDKFELFMRATNLETLQNLFVEISLNLDKTNQELERKERQLIDNNQEVLEAKRKKDMVDSLEIDRQRGTILKMELLWAQVRDLLIEITNKQKDLDKATLEKEKLCNAMASDDQVEPLLQRIESYKADIKVLEAEMKSTDHECKDLMARYKSLCLEYKKLEMEEGNLKTKIKDDIGTIELYKAEIRSQEQKMLPEHVDNRRKQIEEMHKLQRELEQYQADSATKEGARRDFQNKSIAVNDRIDQLKRSRRQCEEESRKLLSQLQGLEAEDSNMSVFGPCMPELMRQIDRCNQWDKKPVGPLGSYVRVKDPKWTLAVEAVLKARLHTFVVETYNDQKLLEQMIRQVINRGTKPGVVRFKVPTQPYDTSRSECRTPHYCNVLDMVDISNMVARNMLIDFCNLESILLIPTTKECFALLRDVRNVPKNWTRAFTQKADIFIPSPNVASYAATSQTVRFLQTSRDEIIRTTQQRIQEVQSKLESIVKDLSAAGKEKIEIDKQEQLVRQAILSISRQSMEAKERLETLKDVELPDTNSVAAYREELALKETELQQKQLALEAFPARLKSVEKEKETLKQMGNQKIQKKRELNEEIESLRRKQTKCREQLDDVQSAQATKKSKLEKVNQLLSKLSSEFEELEEKHATKRADAQRLEDHNRSEAEASMKHREFESQTNTKRHIKVIDQELRSLQKKLASAERTLGQNTESVEQDYIEKIKAYTTTKNFITQLTNNAKNLKQALNDRKSLYHTQKLLSCGVVSHQFTRVLRYRNCTGIVKINFERKQLDITVGPIDEGERSGKGTSSLSGGERSYATMAFVIALWNVTELPFYFLDEFDVFMDVLNRQTVLTLLLRFAKQKRGYQFGFLTPLDTTNITNSDRVLVLKLKDPRT